MSGRTHPHALEANPASARSLTCALKRGEASRFLPTACIRMLILSGFAVTLACTSTALSTSTEPSPAKCQVTVDGSPDVIDAAGGMATANVGTQPECAWTATSDATWIVDPRPSSGQGAAQVQVRVMMNPDPVTRQGQLAVNGVLLRLTQAAAVCRFQISSPAGPISSEGAVVTLALATADGCAWTATTDVPWLALAAPATGNGSATITMTVAANTGTARTGTVTAGGVLVIVSQDAPSLTPPTPTCSYTMNSITYNAAFAGGTGGPVLVTTAPGCAWTATSPVSWVTITSGANGSGAGTLAFIVAANTGAARSATLTIAGQVFTVTQVAAGCTYQVAPNAHSVVAGGGTGTPIVVTTTVACMWTATSGASWLTITSGASGSGEGSVAFTVATNTGAARSGTLTVAGHTLTVNQAAAATCTYQIAPTAQSIGAAGGAGASIAVTTTAGCAWTATSAASWITITSGGSGNGSGTVAFVIAANTGTARSVTLSVAGQGFTITQAAPPCTYGISPTGQSTNKKADTGTIAVTTASSCAWTATSAVSWLSITAGASGIGNGTVHFNIEANDTKNERVGTLTVAGKTFTVMQK